MREGERVPHLLSSGAAPVLARRKRTPRPPRPSPGFPLPDHARGRHARRATFNASVRHDGCRDALAKHGRAAAAHLAIFTAFCRRSPDSFVFSHRAPLLVPLSRCTHCLRGIRCSLFSGSEAPLETSHVLRRPSRARVSLCPRLTGASGALLENATRRYTRPPLAAARARTNVFGGTPRFECLCRKCGTPDKAARGASRRSLKSDP